jgi:uncharacterized membrane protein (DUF4010 family)
LGLAFLALQIAGTLAQRAIGHAGFYAVSVVGGLVSSASAVASAATLTASGMLPPQAGAIGAVLASLVSAMVNLPIAARVTRNAELTRRLSWVLVGVAVLGLVGLLLLERLPALPESLIPGGILGREYSPIL